MDNELLLSLKTMIKNEYNNLISNYSNNELCDFYTSYYYFNIAKPDFLYIIRNKFTGWTKIGISKNPNERFKSLQHDCYIWTNKKNALELLSIVFFPNGNARKAESYLHKKYKQNNVVSEWFDISDDELDKLILYLSEELVSITGSFCYPNFDEMKKPLDDILIFTLINDKLLNKHSQAEKRKSETIYMESYNKKFSKNYFYYDDIYSENLLFKMLSFCFLKGYNLCTEPYFVDSNCEYISYNSFGFSNDSIELFPSLAEYKFISKYISEELYKIM